MTPCPRPRLLAAAIALPAVLLVACGDEEPLAGGDDSTTRLTSAPAVPAAGDASADGGDDGDVVSAASTTLHDAGGVAVGTVAFRPVEGEDDQDHHGAARRAGGATEVVAEIDAPAVATDAFHGIHVHANDDPANGEGCLADPAQPPDTWFATADGHLGAEGELHGAHQGDLPSVLLGADGTGHLELVTERFAVEDVVGAAVVLHAGPDNFANVPLGEGAEQYTANSPAAVEATASAGNAGHRVACGVIEADPGAADTVR